MTVLTRAEPVPEAAPGAAHVGSAAALNLLDRLLGEGDRRAVGLVAAVALLVFANSIGNGFVFDDQFIIVGNPYIRQLRPSIIFLSGYWPDPRMDVLYRPLAILSYAVNFAIGGLTPWGYHLVNVVLHAGVSALVYAVAASLFHNRGLAFFAGIAFALHPIHTEAVANVVGRAELLAALLVFLAWFAYLKALEVDGIRRVLRYAASVICFLLALLSKEHAVVLLGLLVLSDVFLYTQRRRYPSVRGLLRFMAGPLWRVYPSYVATFAVYLLVRYQVLGVLRNPASGIHFVDNPLAWVDLPSRLLTATKVLGKYLWLLMVPYGLSADYSYHVIPLTRRLWDPAVLATISALLLVGACAWMVRRRHPVFLFALGFFMLATLPVSNLLFPIGTIMGERLMYLPSFGFCLALGAVMQMALTRAAGGSRALVTLSLALIVGLSAAYAAGSVLRNRVWRDDESFVRATLQSSPTSARMHKQYGASLIRQGRLEEAQAEMESALKILPDFPEAYNDLGMALTLQGKIDEAVPVFQKAASSREGYADPLYHMAKIYELKGMRAEADEAYRRAGQGIPAVADAAVGIALALYRRRLIPDAQRQLEDAVWRKPESVEVRNNLGLLYLEQDRLEDARRHLQAAAGLRPDSPEVWTNLGKVVQRQGESDRARWAFEKALSLKPDYADAKYSLAILLSGQGAPDTAIAKLEEVLRIDPQNPDAHNTLGALYGQKGDLKRAEQAFQAAVRIDRDSAEAHYNLGTVYARQGKLVAARRELETAIRLKPEHAKAHYNLALLLEQMGKPDEARRHMQISRQQGFSPAGTTAPRPTP